MDCIPQRDWMALWKRAGYSDDGRPAERPDSPVRLWRGSTRGLRRRWSWTDDSDRARWFADRVSLLGIDVGSVWTVLAPPAAYCPGYTHQVEASPSMSFTPAD